MANAGVTVGSVWLDVLPSMRDFGGQLVNQTEQASRQAGERAGDALGEATESGFKGRIAAIAAVGTAIGAAIGVAVSAALDIQAGQAKLQAQLGLTAQESERYGRVAGELYSNAYGDSLTTVNDAIAEVHRNIGENLNDADLSAITGTVLNLADTFGVDLVGSTQAVGQLMRTGLAPDAKTALDVITSGFQAGIDRGGDFMDTLTEYSVQFQKFGLDAHTATGILAQGMQAGARNSDLVADAIKEFSIRAIDGSKLTAEGFAAVGLNAGKMAGEIAKGGPTASAALDLTLDRLRAMPDPVARSQAAVALFGTQAEDLGEALFALDPSAAVSALGEVGGAADRMNQTLGETAQANITSFMRTMQMAFVTTVGGYVIPAITTLAGIIGPVLGPSLSLVGTILTGTVIPAIQGFGQWVQQSQGWLIPLAVGIGAFVLALNAASIATTLWGLATSAAATVMGIARGAVLAFQVGVWLLNAAMAANPVGIIVALLVGLVAGLVAAYQSSETFRNFVNGLWETIKSGAATAWELLQGFFGWLGTAASTVGSALASAWGGVLTAFQAVGDAASWLWNTILSPVFSAIGLGARVLVAVIFTVLVAPWLIAWNLLSAAATAFWTGVVQPVFNGLMSFLGGVWSFLDTNLFMPLRLGLAIVGSWFSAAGAEATGAFQALQAGLAAVWAIIDATVFAAIRYGLNILVTGFLWWKDQVVLAWTLVQAGLAAAWAWIDANVFAYVRLGLNLLVAGFNLYKDGAIQAWQLVQAGLAAAWSWIQSNVFQPIQQYLIGPLVGAFNTARDMAVGAWNALKDGIATVWNFILNNIWQPLVNFVTRDIPNAFNTAVEAVGRVWDGLREKFAAPIRFVVDVVYNKGIVPAWNWIAGVVNLPQLSTVGLGFASGGAVRGPGTGTSDDIPAWLSNGEHVWTSREVRAAGGHANVEALRELALNPNLGKRDPKLLNMALATGKLVEGADHDGPGISTTGFGGVRPHVAQAGHYLGRKYGIRSIGGVGARANASDHPKGLALDFMTSGENGTALANDVLGNMAHFAGKYVIWRQRINSGTGWRGMENRGSPTANHMDHVHVSFNGTPGQGGYAGGGAFFDPAAWVKKLFAKAIDSLAGLAGDNQWASMGAELAKTSVNGAVDWFVKWVTDNISRVASLILPFDSGGFLPTGWSTVYNGTGRPEPVLTDAQWSAMAENGAGTDGAALGGRIDDLIDAVRNARPITVEDRSGNPVETARAAQLALRLAR